MRNPVQAAGVSRSNAPFSSSWDHGTLSAPIEGTPEVVYRGTPSEQGGLLDVAIDPEFQRNRLVYLSYTEAADQQPESIGETGDVRFGGHLDLSDDIVRGGAVARGRLQMRRRPLDAEIAGAYGHHLRGRRASV